MKRNPVFLLAAVLAIAACGPSRPLTESEFKGFCYQGGENRFQSCDTISVCNEYTTVMGLAQPSLGACLNECEAIYTAQRRRIGLGECAVAAQDARDWCQRYCRSNYPK